jgi:hypothetical protein
MRTLHGHLEYSPKKRGFIQLFDRGQEREFDIWPYIDTTFPILNGLPVILEVDDYSFSLTRGDTDFVFQYGGSLEDMRLKKHSPKESIDVAKNLDILLARLNGQEVVVEADDEHFKISAVPKEQ